MSHCCNCQTDTARDLAGIDLAYFPGDTLPLTITISTADGRAVDITAKRIDLLLRFAETDADTDALWHYHTGPGGNITKLEPQLGIAIVHLSRADTLKLTPRHYPVAVYVTDGYHATAATGTLRALSPANRQPN